MNIGTPAIWQLEWGVKPVFLPLITSSFSFFMCSLTQGIRFGLVRSAIRKVGCLPTPLGTKGCAGSVVTDPGVTPGTGSKNGPPPFIPAHPA